MSDVENFNKYKEREFNFFYALHSNDNQIDEIAIKNWCKIENYKKLSDFLYFYFLLYEKIYQNSKKNEEDKSNFSNSLVFTKIDILELKDYLENNSIIETEFLKNIDSCLNKLNQKINSFQFINLSLEEKVEKACNLKENNNAYEEFMKEWTEDSEKYKKKAKFENIYKIMGLFKKWFNEYGYLNQ